MPNCKVGDLAVIVKSLRSDSKNIGKIVKIERQASLEELQQLHPDLWPGDDVIVWKVNNTVEWYYEFDQSLVIEANYCLDVVLKPLKGLDQDSDENEEHALDKLAAYKAVYSKEKETV